MDYSHRSSVQYAWALSDHRLHNGDGDVVEERAPRTVWKRFKTTFQRSIAVAAAVAVGSHL